MFFSLQISFIFLFVSFIFSLFLIPTVSFCILEFLVLLVINFCQEHNKEISLDFLCEKLQVSPNDLDKALADVKNYGPGLTEKILPQVNNASDGWLLYDRRYYVGDELFEGLSRELQNFSDRK